VNFLNTALFANNMIVKGVNNMEQLNVGSEQKSKAVERQTLTVKEAAELLGVSAWTIYDMVRKGELPAIRVRSRIFFRREGLDAWIKDRELDVN
jgi:excisionase family DNA binding protein